MEETGENHRSTASHWQTLSHNVSSTPGLSGICTHTDCIGRCTYNYHTIMTTRVPQRCYMFPAHIHVIGFSSKHRSFKFPPSQIYFMLTYHRNVSSWSIIYILGCILPDMFYIATSQTTLRLLHHKQNLGCHTIIISVPSQVWDIATSHSFQVGPSDIIQVAQISDNFRILIHVLHCCHINIDWIIYFFQYQQINFSDILDDQKQIKLFLDIWGIEVLLRTKITMIYK